MRVALGRIALLLGLVVVVGMGWFGAAALLDEDEPERTIRGEQRECEATSERAAKRAQRAFLEEYVPGDAAADWLSGVGVSHTDVLPDTIQMQRSVFGYVVVPVEGEGWFVQVTQLVGSSAPNLPLCLGEVPLVVTYGGRVVAN